MRIRITYTKGFIRDFKQLRKRYRRIEDDWDSLIAEMDESGYRGARMSGFRRAAFKVRLTNRSARRGKSGGFRAIYRVEAPLHFRFVHIYSKTDKEDVSDSEVNRMLYE